MEVGQMTGADGVFHVAGWYKLGRRQRGVIRSSCAHRFEEGAALFESLDKGFVIRDIVQV